MKRRNVELNNLRVRDGESLVIAGLINEEERQQVNKVPFFGDLPVVGFLFRNSSNTKVKSELVIMLTPHIVYDDDDDIPVVPAPEQRKSEENAQKNDTKINDFITPAPLKEDNNTENK